AARGVAQICRGPREGRGHSCRGTAGRARGLGEQYCHPYRDSTAQTWRGAAPGMKTEANARAERVAATPYQRLVMRLERIEDGAMLRAAFFTLLLGTLGVLYV